MNLWVMRWSPSLRPTFLHFALDIEYWILLSLFSKNNVEYPTLNFQCPSRACVGVNADLPLFFQLQLLQLRPDHKRAVGGVGIVLVVILMVVFRFVEFLQWLDLGDNGVFEIPLSFFL